MFLLQGGFVSGQKFGRFGSVQCRSAIEAAETDAGGAVGFGAALEGLRKRRGSSSSSMWKSGGVSNAGCSDLPG